MQQHIMGLGIYFTVIPLFLSVILSHSEGVQFPKDEVEQCAVGDTECIARITEHILINQNMGIKKLNLVPLEPLLIDKMDIIQGHNSPVRVALNFRNMAINGLSGGKVLHIKGFERDFDGKKMEIKVHFGDSLILAGNYKVSGQVLILPIQGNGKCNLTLNNLDFTVKFLSKSVTKDDGEEYMQIEKAKTAIQNVGRLYMYFENLFNGDRALGENMNSFLNEHWREIFSELRGSIETAFAEIFKHLANQVFMNIPYKDLFKQ